MNIGIGSYTKRQTILVLNDKREGLNHMTAFERKVLEAAKNERKYNITKDLEQFRGRLISERVFKEACKLVVQNFTCDKTG